MTRYPLVALMILLSCALANAAEPSGSFLTVSGNAEVQAVPDQAVINLGFIAQAPDARQAQEQVNKQMQGVIDALKNAGLPAEKIQTSQLALHPVYEDRKRDASAEPRIVGYRAANSVRATIDDLSKVGASIDAAIAAGANQVNSLEFQLKNDADARKQALQRAASEAMQKARVLAEATGVILGDPADISESGVSVNPPRPMMYQARAMAAATPVEPGQVTVNAAVQIRYRVTTK